MQGISSSFSTELIYSNCFMSTSDIPASDAEGVMQSVENLAPHESASCEIEDACLLQAAMLLDSSGCSSSFIDSSALGSVPGTEAQQLSQELPRTAIQPSNTFSGSREEATIPGWDDEIPHTPSFDHCKGSLISLDDLWF
jgi:hypothetical protein